MAGASMATQSGLPDQRQGKVHQRDLGRQRSESPLFTMFDSPSPSSSLSEPSSDKSFSSSGTPPRKEIGGDDSDFEAPLQSRFSSSSSSSSSSASFSSSCFSSLRSSPSLPHLFSSPLQAGAAVRVRARRGGSRAGQTMRQRECMSTQAQPQPKPFPLDYPSAIPLPEPDKFYDVTPVIRDEELCIEHWLVHTLDWPVGDNVDPLHFDLQRLQKTLRAYALSETKSKSTRAKEDDDFIDVRLGGPKYADWVTKRWSAPSLRPMTFHTTDSLLYALGLSSTAHSTPISALGPSLSDYVSRGAATLSLYSIMQRNQRISFAALPLNRVVQEASRIVRGSGHFQAILSLEGDKRKTEDPSKQLDLHRSFDLCEAVVVKLLELEWNRLTGQMTETHSGRNDMSGKGTEKEGSGSRDTNEESKVDQTINAFNCIIGVANSRIGARESDGMNRSKKSTANLDASSKLIVGEGTTRDENETPGRMTGEGERKVRVVDERKAD
ncbi:hypothetical protein FA10DRAFT_278311, partial [Acaromyces ingoldii]